MGSLMGLHALWSVLQLEIVVLITRRWEYAQGSYTVVPIPVNQSHLNVDT